MAEYKGELKMAEYIEKTELIKKLCTETAEWYYSPTIKTIKDFPAANVQPAKRGEWGKRAYDRLQCSCCGKCEDIATDFCPNCGADMRNE